VARNAQKDRPLGRGGILTGEMRVEQGGDEDGTFPRPWKEALPAQGVIDLSKEISLEKTLGSVHGKGKL